MALLSMKFKFQQFMKVKILTNNTNYLLLQSPKYHIKNLSMNKIFLLLAILVAVMAIPNQRPIIGVYTQSDEDDEPRLQSAAFQTYIAASYVKFIQMSGAQVVPIFAYSPQSDIAALLPKLNGVLFPGGGVQFDIKNIWTSNANYIFQYAIKQNDLGNVFPLWGTCLGHQLLGFLTNNFSTPLTPVRGQTAVLNTIKFTNPADRGTLFSDMPDRLITKLTTGQGITYFNHHYAISSYTYNTNRQLHEFWKIIGETTSSYNEKFVSVWEARKYPFYGVQFHPEKAIFEWKVYSDKSYDSMEMTQIISNKFIEKARQSKNQFSAQADFEKISIYNYNIYPTSMSFTRIYLFNETKPAVPLLGQQKGEGFRIQNPDSSKFISNWGKQHRQNLMTQE